METIGLEQVNSYLLQKQHLAIDARSDDLVRTASDICGLHGTNPITSYLSLLSRTSDFSREQLDNELYVKKTLIKARCMRGTLYLLPPDLLTITFAALKDPMIKACMNYCRNRGVSEKAYGELSGEILALLERGGLTATEIKKQTGTSLNISPVLILMCDQGLLVRGPPRGGWTSNKHTYHLSRQYLPGLAYPGIPAHEAISGLIRAYLAAFGPATVADITWWTGLTMTKVRKGLAELGDEMSWVDISDLEGRFAMLEKDEPALRGMTLSKRNAVSLLPTMDGYVMGYRGRARYLDDKYYGYVFDRSGNATNTILVNGRIAGVWDTEAGDRPCVKFFTFETADDDDDLLREIRRQAAEIGFFMFGKTPGVKGCRSMVPLSQRPPGSVMSPLRGE